MANRIKEMVGDRYVYLSIDIDVLGKRHLFEFIQSDRKSDQKYRAWTRPRNRMPRARWLDYSRVEEHSTPPYFSEHCRSGRGRGVTSV